MSPSKEDCATYLSVCVRTPSFISAQFRSKYSSTKLTCCIGSAHVGFHSALCAYVLCLYTYTVRGVVFANMCVHCRVLVFVSEQHLGTFVSMCVRALQESPDKGPSAMLLVTELSVQR